MDKTCVFDFTYFYQTKRGKHGVVRADDIEEAAVKVNDTYRGLDDECDGIVCLNRIEDGLGIGIVEMDGLIRIGK